MVSIVLPATGIAFDCASCDEDLDHCHGTLITHDDAAECTDQACASLDPARHELRISCDELPDCACATPRPAELAAAS